MKLIFVIVYLFVFCADPVFSQRKTHPSTPIEILSIAYPRPGESMEYRFPSNVTKLLNKLLSGWDNNSPCFVASFDADTVTLTVVSSGIPIKPQYTPLSPIDSGSQILMQSTNRHWVYKSEPMAISGIDSAGKVAQNRMIRPSHYRSDIIPIYFRSDMYFSFVNWTINDGYIIRFKCRNWTDENCIILDKNW